MHLDKAVDCVYLLLTHLLSHRSLSREVLLFALLIIGLFFLIFPNWLVSQNWIK